MSGSFMFVEACFAGIFNAERVYMYHAGLYYFMDIHIIHGMGVLVHKLEWNGSRSNLGCTSI